MSGYLQQPDLHAIAPHRAAQLTYPGNLQAALREAQADPTKTLFGIAQGIPSVFLTKVFASAKPDIIFIDVEHGMFDRLVLHDAIHAAAHHSEGKTMVIVRVPKHDEISLTTALDAGASGIIFPHCESAEEVKELISHVYYPPVGRRSFSPWIFTPGVSDQSIYPDDAFNIATSTRHVVVIPQIESVKGMENVEKIAALDGVGALMFGPGDFMLDAGITPALGGIPDPRLLQAMTKFSEVGKKYNRPLLGGATSMEMTPMLIEQGFRILLVAWDVWSIAQMVSTAVAKGRELAGAKSA